MKSQVLKMPLDEPRRSNISAVLTWLPQPPDLEPSSFNSSAYDAQVEGLCRGRVEVSVNRAKLFVFLQPRQEQRSRERTCLGRL